MIILIKKKSHDRSSMKIAQLSSKYPTRTSHSSSVTFRGAQKISHLRFLLNMILSVVIFWTNKPELMMLLPAAKPFDFVFNLLSCFSCAAILAPFWSGTDTSSDIFWSFLVRIGQN